MRLLIGLLCLIATPIGLAQDDALGIWTRADSTVIPAKGYVPEILVDVRQVEVTDTTVVFTSILRATSGEERGNLIAQRMTVSRQFDAQASAIELSTADLEVRGDTLILTDHAIPVRSGAYVRSTGRIPEGTAGVWALPANVRGPEHIEITPRGDVLNGGDTLFAAIAVLGDYVVTADQDFADKEAYERGERDFETFEVYGLRQLDADRLSIHLPPEAPIELTRTTPVVPRLETWATAEAVDLRALYPDVPAWRRAAVVYRQLEVTHLGLTRTVLWQDSTFEAGVLIGFYEPFPESAIAFDGERAVIDLWSGEAVYTRATPTVFDAALVGTWAGETRHPETGAIEPLRLQIGPSGEASLLSSAAARRYRIVGPYLVAEDDSAPRSGPQVYLSGGRIELVTPADGEAYIAWPSASAPGAIRLTRQPDDAP